MSASNINSVALTGRLTSDPDLRELPSGASVCHLRIAVNARRRNAEGEWVAKPNFFDVIVFGTKGESVARYMRKGRAVAVAGRLDWREWETRDGRAAQAVSIVAWTVQFLDAPPFGTGAPTDEFDDAGDLGLHSIDGGEEEDLDFADQEAIAAAAV